MAGAAERISPDTAGWLSVGEAARILGLSERAVRWRCLNARLRAVLVGTAGEAAWRIDPDANPAFRVARGQAPIVGPAGDVLLAASAAKRASAGWRYDAVRLYEAAMAERPEPVPAARWRCRWLDGWNRLHPDRRISARSLLRWRRRLGESGLAGLVDRRRYAGPAAVCPEAWEMFLGLYLEQERPHVPRLYERVEAVAATEGWSWPSLRTVQRRIAAEDPKLLNLGRDPKRFRDRSLPYVERDWSLVPAMGCWIGDHRQHDILLPRRVNGSWRWYRPWMTMYLDGRSWMPAAWRIEFDSPDGNRTMATFAAGVREHGRPDWLYLDNGKDFRMRRFAGGRSHPARKGEKVVAEQHVKPILAHLGVEATFALPYNAKAKCVEPFFRLVAEWFDKTWPTYCGNRTDVRPERLRAMKPERFAAEGLTIEAFREAFDAWLTTDYSLRVSPSAAAGGLSPARAFATLRAPGWQAVRPAAETMSLLLMPSQACRVEANGVYCRPFGRHYWSAELEDRRGASARDERRRVVYRYDPDDDSMIFVFDARTDRYLCTAEPYIGTGVHPLANDQHVAAVMEQRNHLAKTYAARVKELRAKAGNRLLAEYRQAAENLGRLDDPATIPTHDTTPPTIRLVGGMDEAGAERARRRSRTRQPGPSAAEILATGTDDSSPGSRREISSLELMEEEEEGTA